MRPIRSMVFGPKKHEHAPDTSYWMTAPRDGWQAYIEAAHLKRMMASHYGRMTDGDARRVIGLEE